MTPRLAAPALLTLTDEVSEARSAGTAIVALESTLISHGLPTSTSAETARRIETAVRACGAVPATVAVLDGAVRIGLSADQLLRVAEEPDVVKTSVRDLGQVLARGVAGATTVAATAYIARLAGLRVFATGGLGGVHRNARESWDESADLTALAGAAMTVVCSGVKSILDVAATLERLESLSVPVLGFGTDRMPGFYVRDAGLPVPWRIDSAEEVAAVMGVREALGLPQALVVAQPVAPEDEMARDLHDHTLATALVEAGRLGVTGKDVTPFLLGWFHEHTGGASLHTNVALVVANARLAAEIAVANAERVGAPDRERLTARDRS